MKREHAWPIGVVTVLLATVLANLALLRAASSPGADVTEPDYYRKALAWDSTAAAERRSRATGWTADARLVRAGGRLELWVRLNDAAGAPVDGANVTVEAIHNLEAGHPSTLVLVPSGHEYRATIPSSRSGLWELRIVAHLGAENFSANLRREAPQRVSP